MDNETGSGGYPPAPGGGFPGGVYGATGYGPPAYSKGAIGNADVMLPPGAAGPPRPNYFHTASLGLLVMFPSLMFSVISVTLAFLFHKLPGMCWSLTTFCASISVMFILVRPVREGPRYWFNLGCVCLLATVAANVTGFWNQYRHFGVYWAYEGQRVYLNVSPGEHALSHLDAGKIAFSLETRVDLSASVGLADGDRFCVAPVVGTAPAKTVEYWAAGVNCCDQDGKNFTCDEVTNKDARSGLVYLDYGPRSEHLGQFRRAAREAGAAHGAAPSADALFVSWVEDPDVAQQWYWDAGIAFLVGGLLSYVGFSLVLGVVLHFGRRTPPSKTKLEGRNL